MTQTCALEIRGERLQADLRPTLVHVGFVLDGPQLGLAIIYTCRCKILSRTYNVDA